MEVILALVALVFIVAVVSGLSQGKKQSEVVSANRTTPSRISDFTATVSYSGTGKGVGIAIDAQRYKFALLRGHDAPSIYHFRDLIAVEVLKNENSVTKTDRGSQLAGAVVGGALLGPAGLIVGGLSGSKRNENKITKLSMKIYTNDLLNPVSEAIFLDFTGLQGLPENDPGIRGAIDNLDAWNGRLKTILAMQQSIPTKP